MCIFSGWRMMWDAHRKRSSGYRTPRVQAGLLPRDYRAVWEASFTGSLWCRHLGVPGCQPGHQEEGDQSISLPSLLSSALLLLSDNLGFFSFTERIDIISFPLCKNNVFWVLMDISLPTICMMLLIISKFPNLVAFLMSFYLYGI